MFKDFSNVDLRIGKGDNPPLTAPLREDRSKPVKAVTFGKTRGPRKHACEGLAASNDAPPARLLGLGLLQRREREQLDFARRLAAIFEVAIATAAAGDG
jgi:hypothetical protein